MNELTTTRTPEIVAAEIRTFTASMLGNIIEIGRRMVEVKEMLDHGKFYPWLETNTGYKKSSANNFMRLYEEYGDKQGNLFGAEVSNLQTFGGLTYSKALALLALPSGEREEFVETHDVEDMSTRERDEAKAAAEAEWSAKVKEAEDKLAKASISGDADLAAFQLLFEVAQTDVNKMRGLLLKVRGRENSELGEKLTAALLALAEKVAESLNFLDFLR